MSAHISLRKRTTAFPHSRRQRAALVSRRWWNVTDDDGIEAKASQRKAPAQKPLLPLSQKRTFTAHDGPRQCDRGCVSEGGACARGWLAQGGSETATVKSLGSHDVRLPNVLYI